jgi:VWFA-related protein
MSIHARQTKLRALAACGLTLVVCALSAHAQQPGAPQTSGDVPPASGRVLNVTALDDNGRPVTDLTSADFKVLDDGKVRPIANFNAILTPSTGKTQTPTALVLFDLLNSQLSQRDYLCDLIIHTLEPLERGDSVYFYLLTNRGELYPVRVLSLPQQSAVPPAGPPWTAQISAQLHQAMQNVHGLRPKADDDLGVRSYSTFWRLAELEDQFKRFPGPKSIVWITQGAPNWVDYPHGCKDAIFPLEIGSYAAGKCGSACTMRPGVMYCIDYAPFLGHFGTVLTQSDTILDVVEAQPEASLPPNSRGTSFDTIQQLADVSGGRIYFSGAIESAVTQALQVVRAHYELTYDPPRPNGKYHKLRVECSRKGVHIAAPHGYIAG